MEYEQLTRQIIGCAMQVHRVLGPGFLESVYQNALTHELRKAGLRVECQRPLSVTYDHVVVGKFEADMVIEDVVLIENKAVQSLAAAHEIQLVNYLTATGINIGLLINFGASRLEFQRKHRIYKPKQTGSTGVTGSEISDAQNYPGNPENPVKPPRPDDNPS